MRSKILLLMQVPLLGDGFKDVWDFFPENFGTFDTFDEI